VISTVDPESRHIHKTVHSYRDGYKAHLAIEPDTGLVTAVALTPGNVGDGTVAAALLAGEEPGLEVYADSAYGSGQTRAELRALGHDSVIKPMPLQTAVPGGFSRDDFIVDHRARTVTCPAGHTVTMTAANNAVFGTRCHGCPLRSRCTNAKHGRTIHLRDHDDELEFGRVAWRDQVLRDHYRQHRPMVERTIAWLVARGHRRLRYQGTQRNRIWLAHRAAAINLQRLLNLGLTSNRDTKFAI
jgi:IS5 family transposase